MNLLNILVGPITEALTKTIPDVNKRAEAQEAIQQAIVNSNDKALEAMSSTMAADAASDGILTRNARPIVVLWSLGMVSYLIFWPSQVVFDAMRAVPDQLWNLISIGIGGYTLARTAEKVTSTIVKGVRK